MTTAPERTALYRIFDTEDSLLYVGIAVNPESRWKQHARDKTWWPSAARREVEWHASREDAEQAEAAAIVSEVPRYNVRHSTTRQHGDARQERCGKATPLRMVRIPDDEWEALGQAVGDRNRARLIREFIRWRLRWPASKQPERAAEQIGGPGISSKGEESST